MTTRIRLGMLGLNFGGWMIEHELSGGAGHAAVEIVAVCDRDAAKVAMWSARLGVPGYTDVRALLTHAGLQAVGVFTGPVGRADLIEQIILAGYDVMTTKPFDADLHRATAVLALAQRLGRVIHLNSPAPQMTPDLAQLAAWATAYQLGRPIAYRATTWCSYREQPDGSWYDDPHACPAAPLFRLGIYLMNDVSWFFGAVARVDVQQSRIFTQRPTADNAQLAVQYADGALGTLFASFCIDDQQYYRCALEINFARGTLYRNVGPTPTALQQVQLAGVVVADGQAVQLHAETPAQGAGYQWAVFQEAVLQNHGMTAAYGERIIAGLRMLEAMRVASQSA